MEEFANVVMPMPGLMGIIVGTIIIIGISALIGWFFGGDMWDEDN